MDALLAKSVKTGYPPVTLSAHSLDVAECATLLFGTWNKPTALGQAWRRFFQLEDFDRFLLNLIVACLFHDLGKATAGFQQALLQKLPQIFRHEHLSTFLLMLEPIRKWLVSHSDIYYPGVLAAVAGHHLKASERTVGGNNAFVFGEALLDWWEEGKPHIQMYFGHPDIRQIFERLSQVLGIPLPEDLPLYNLAWSKTEIQQFEKLFKREVHRYKSCFIQHDKPLHQEQRLMMALKAGVIVCDALGSAMPRMEEKGNDSYDWANRFVRDCFSGDPLNGDWLEKEILSPRIEEMIRHDGTPFEPHSFQKEIKKQPDRTLLLSGCGTGKTLAAWYWIQAHLGRYKVGRVLFLYPTRATATEGFKDYASWAGKQASLLHGTALYELQGMFNNPEEEDKYKTDERLFALGFWNKKVITATVDSFLGFMANGYASICLLPVLANSILVIDEVHAFDSAMFKALQEFLRHFDIPVLCMTASLQQERVEILTNKLELKPFPEALKDFPTLKRQMSYPRYQIAWSTNDNAQNRIFKAYEQGCRILWVVNQVDRCQEFARFLRDEKNLPQDVVLCYHSRFTLDDRKQVHQRAINQFKEHKEKSEGKGLILVTTQVCEMSLDLDADLLVTDLAPVSSLIQRMGRCCRRNNFDDYGVVLVVEPDNERPYQPDELKEGRKFIEEMLNYGQRISQSNMDDYLKEMDNKAKLLEGPWTAFVRGGLYSPPSAESPFRDTDDFCMDAVLTKDIDEYQRRRKEKNPSCDGLVVPVPKYLIRTGILKQNSKLPQGLVEAPHTHYSKEFGFYKEEVPDYERSTTPTYLFV